MEPLLKVCIALGLHDSEEEGTRLILDIFQIESYRLTRVAIWLMASEIQFRGERGINLRALTGMFLLLPLQKN